MKMNFNKLHVQRSVFGEKMVEMHYVGHFIMLMIIKKLTTPQTMHYIFCHNNPILNLNPKNQARRWLIICEIINGITALRKRVTLDQSNVLNFFEEEMNCPLREEKKPPFKKRQNISFNSIFIYFYKRTFQERGCATKTKFGRFRCFNCQKPSSFIVCGK